MLTQNAHNEIVALKAAQAGSHEGIQALTNKIYEDVSEKWQVLEGGLRSELLEKIETECGGLTNAVVSLSVPLATILNLDNRTESRRTPRCRNPCEDTPSSIQPCYTFGVRSH